MHRFMRFVAAAMLLSSATYVAPADAQSTVPRYCYDGTCHASLEAAEAAMRADAGVLGPYIRKEKTTVVPSGNSLGAILNTVYIVPNQPPDRFYPHGYGIGGWSSKEGICAPTGDPLDPDSCLDKYEMAAGYFERQQRTFPQCQHTYEGFVGAFGEPYIYLRSSKGFGEIVTSSTKMSEEFVYTIKCPGRSESLRSVYISRHQTYTCPSGFWPENANNPVYTGTGQARIEWPLICTAGSRKYNIQTQRVTQTETCPANNNPCYPATGDKARQEIDFRFAGRDFTRFYHSLGQIQSPAGMGIGWSHSYSDYLGSPRNSRRSRISEDGYLQTFTSTDGRGDQSHGHVLIKSSSSVGVVRAPDGSRRHYNVDGVLTAVSTASPATSVSLVYGSTGRIQSITDGLGHSLKFEYVADYLKTITLPDGARFEYTHDDFGNLTSVQRPDGSVRYYLYGEPGHVQSEGRHLLTGIVDDDERYATFSYAADGRVLSSVLHADGEDVDRTEVTYGQGTARSINPMGLIGDHTITTGQYLGLGVTQTSMGTITRVRDTRGRVTSFTDANGNVTRTTYQDFTSGAIGQVVTKVEEGSGRVTVTTRDSNNLLIEDKVLHRQATGDKLMRLQRYAYDAGARKVAECLYDVNQSTSYECGSSAVAPLNVRQWGWRYCADSDDTAICPLPGLLLAEWEAGMHPDQAQRHVYYAQDAVACAEGGVCGYRKGDLKEIVNALGHRTEFLEYDAQGRAILARHPDGRLVETLYDDNGNRASVTLRASSGDRVTLYRYSSDGRMLERIDPTGASIKMRYDTAKRLRAVEDALGNRIEYTLDAGGNVIKEDVRDAHGVLRKTVRQLYDAEGRMVVRKDSAGNETQTTRDANGNPILTADPMGRTLSQRFDARNQVVETIQAGGAIEARIVREVDILGRITKVTDPKGLETKYEFNGFGDLIRQTSPDTGVTLLSRDAAGRVSSRTDARGVSSSISYDVLGRQTAVRYPDSAEDVARIYDVAAPSCSPGEQAAIGRLTSVVTADTRLDYCYNDAGDMVHRVQVVDGVQQAIRYGFSPNGALDRMTYPDGSEVDYVLDAMGRVTELGLTTGSGPRQVVLSDVSYLPFGPTTGWAFGNGREVRRAYDLDYRPTTVRGGTNGLDLSIGYDAVGQVSTLGHASSQMDGVRLRYDGLGRLEGLADAQTGITIDHYEYDATGNRVRFSDTHGVVDYTYESDSHRLIAVDQEQREYDAMGNTTLIGDGVEFREFVNDQRGRLASVLVNDVEKAAYVYNGLGERVSSRQVNSTDVSIYESPGKWLGRQSTDGGARQQIIWLDSLPVGLLQDDALKYLETDHIGSVRAVVDPHRDLPIWRWSELGEAFGSTEPNIDPDMDGEVFRFDMRFPGQLRDESFDGNYNYFRDYSSAHGRYLQSDPIGLLGGPSTYGYAQSDPLGSIDPLGLVKWTGTMHGFSVGNFGFAGAMYNFSLASDCVDGRMAFVDIDANFIGSGFGFPVTYTISRVTLDDGASNVNPSNLTGGASMYGAGVALGGGAAYSCIFLDKASTDCSPGGIGGQGGADWSIYAYGKGISKLDGPVKWVNCGECDK